MSRRAIDYVQSITISDPQSQRVLLALADRTRPSQFDQEPDPILGLILHDSEIAQLADSIGIGEDAFRRILRELRDTVPMDVLEHSDGQWEIVYGPPYTNPTSATSTVDTITEANVQNVHSFNMPGWENYSTWGYDTGLACLYAQLYLNQDDRDGRPRIWITPPQHVIIRINELAEVIATEIASFGPVSPPTEVVLFYLTNTPNYR